MIINEILLVIIPIRNHIVTLFFEQLRISIVIKLRMSTLYSFLRR